MARRARCWRVRSAITTQVSCNEAAKINIHVAFLKMASGQLPFLGLLFPFSDLSASKLRPALLLANVDKGDWVLCQITSKPYADARAITLTEADFAQGGLQLTSYARAGKLFTAHESLFQRVAGTLQTLAHQRVVDQVVALLRDGADSAG